MQLPEVLAVDHNDGRFGRIKVVEETCIDADPASAAVPASVCFEGWAVGNGGAPARGAEVMRHEFRIPPIGRIVG